MKVQRLKKRKEFLFLASCGWKASTPGLVLQLLKREDMGSVRVGFTVTKKIGNAVVRNRVRRRLRAVVQRADVVIQGYDVVLIGRAGTRRRSFDVLVADFCKALQLCQKNV